MRTISDMSPCSNFSCRAREIEQTLSKPSNVTTEGNDVLPMGDRLPYSVIANLGESELANENREMREKKGGLT